jgi:hypothetical protein
VGHEYVASEACKAWIGFSKEDNCFTHVSDAAGSAKIAGTLSEQGAISLRRVCERSGSGRLRYHPRRQDILSGNCP